MKGKNIVIGIIVVLLIGFAIYLLSNQKQQTFKKVTLSRNNIIRNKPVMLKIWIGVFSTVFLFLNID